MLTRDLLLYRIHKGTIVPRFIKDADPRLLRLAETLVALPTDETLDSRGALEDTIEESVRAFPRLKVAKGLAKLLIDRCSFDEPDDQAAQRRAAIFSQSVLCMQTLPDDATPEDFRTALHAATGTDLAALQAELYDDLPQHRRLVDFRAITPQGLLQRYNLAQVQGLVLHAQSLTIDAQPDDVLQVRRVLRWMRFCRLVGAVEQSAKGWRWKVEGPAAMFAMQKKYGLQLAMFVGAIPVLGRYTLRAEVKLRERAFRLELDETSPLVSPYDKALGHIPAEIQQFAKKFSEDDWQLSLDVPPRHVGAKGVAVPDFRLEHSSGATLDVELFHRWHQGMLLRRLQDLDVRPDAGLVIGVDRAACKDESLRQRLDEHPQVFLFSSFPQVSKLRPFLAKAVEA